MTILKHIALELEFPYPNLVEVHAGMLTNAEIMQHGMRTETGKVLVPLTVALKAADRKLRRGESNVE